MVKQMITIGFAVSLVLGVSGAASAQQASMVAQGQAVYAAQKCSICHSIEGKGNQKGALDGVGSKLSADETRNWIVAAPEMAAKTKATRKPLMKAYTAIPKGDLDALVAYMQSLKKS
jgi:mono/diheme cytochrome c family protein